MLDRFGHWLVRNSPMICAVALISAVCLLICGLAGD